jgi:hypothetical protein
MYQLLDCIGQNAKTLDIEKWDETLVINVERILAACPNLFIGWFIQDIFVLTCIYPCLVPNKICEN